MNLRGGTFYYDFDEDEINSTVGMAFFKAIAQPHLNIPKPYYHIMWENFSPFWKDYFYFPFEEFSIVVDGGLPNENDIYQAVEDLIFNTLKEILDKHLITSLYNPFGDHLDDDELEEQLIYLRKEDNGHILLDDWPDFFAYLEIGDNYNLQLTNTFKGY